ncbi:hypothetical protein AAIR98_001833 [Elusimicrobium simillimum]|uniref:hypothetical protein n=1 Tax=Elusimicrobium simillimum TaxID=3143438 RepID=UPI003C6FA07B
MSDILNKNEVNYILRTLKNLSDVNLDSYLQTHLYNNPKYKDPAKLNLSEFKVFSQGGEDGLIQEIFKRIGTTPNRFFVEFGVETGVETNTTYLLHNNWRGAWIDGGQENINAINQSFKSVIADGKLKVLQSFITAENIESLFAQAAVPYEFDLLSIDIDRNDYHVWSAINKYSPRVVCIEYNAIFRPGCEFIVPYDPQATWDGTTNFGASLQSLYNLGETKGYTLVACTFSGVNAFFVRDDLVENLFTGPFTPENHYEPARYFLTTLTSGHPRRINL